MVEVEARAVRGLIAEALVARATAATTRGQEDLDMASLAEGWVQVRVRGVEIDQGRLYSLKSEG